jgi:hypothetical protein
MPRREATLRLRQFRRRQRPQATLQGEASRGTAKKAVEATEIEVFNWGVTIRFDI